MSAVDISYQFSALIVIALTFSVASLINTEYRLIAKIIAGISWFILALTQFFFFGGGNVIAPALMFLFIGFGLVYCFFIVTDFKQRKRDEVWSFD